MDIHPQKIEGLWQFGAALDFHTTSSTPTGPNQAGHMQFETVRPPIAELLYRLKYLGNRSAADGIIQAAAAWLSPHRAKLDVLVPVPPSTVRQVQPVLLLANGLGAAAALPVANCITTTRSPAALKAIEEPARRETLLNGLYQVDPRFTARRNVLLFDDIFRSGATMNEINKLLLGQGRAASVRALTITRTRAKR